MSNIHTNDGCLPLSLWSSSAKWQWLLWRLRAFWKERFNSVLLLWGVNFQTLQRHRGRANGDALISKHMGESSTVTSSHLVRARPCCVRTNSCTQEQWFSVWTALALLILFFMHLCSPAWPCGYTCGINEPVMSGPRRHSLSFHKAAAQLCSQSWAWQCSCHSNQNKHFILLDLARPMFPWAKQRRAPPSLDIPPLQMDNERKIEQEVAQNMKTRTSLVQGDSGSWRVIGPQSLWISRPLHAILLGLPRNLLFSLVWWLWRETQSPVQQTKQPKTKTNTKKELRFQKRQFLFYES